VHDKIYLPADDLLTMLDRKRRVAGKIEISASRLSARLVDSRVSDFARRFIKLEAPIFFGATPARYVILHGLDINKIDEIEFVEISDVSIFAGEQGDRSFLRGLSSHDGHFAFFVKGSPEFQARELGRPLVGVISKF
jgi:hypothetical protein